MALKKVKSVIVSVPSWYHGKSLEQDEKDIKINGEEEPSMNQQLNTSNSDNLYGGLPVSVSTTVRRGSAMERIITFEEDSVSMQRVAKVAEGVYEFRIDKITIRENVQTQYGIKNQYVISFSLYSEITEQETTLSLPYNISSNQQSALMMFLRAFKGVFKGQKITIGQLVGLTGQARIYHVVSDAGDVFEKIEIMDVEKP